MDNGTELIPVFHSTNSSIERVRSRIHYKMRDYATYRFTAPQSCAINIFFDLAQEFEELQEIHLLSVLILRMFFQYEGELYLKDEHGCLVLVTPAVGEQQSSVPELREEIWNDNSHCYIPVRRRGTAPATETPGAPPAFPPASPPTSPPTSNDEDDLLGVLVLHVNKVFASHDLLFLEKFANRLGFCLHNKLLALRNVRHVTFLRKLAHDIGHNIITPNMRMKLLIHHLEGQIASLAELGQGPPDEALLRNIRVLQGKMAEHIKEMMGTFQNTALFLESLLRQSHFDLGRYVLRRSRLDVCSLIVLPQFARYRQQFEERKLRVDMAQPVCLATPCFVEADLGLISQVLANLLSNAAKYAAPVDPDLPGEVRCTVGIEPEGFGPGVPGAKISVFSSGRHIPPEEAARLFDDNFRASNSMGQFGTGHGLFFVREIIAEHRGKTGYEPAEGGNVFYFMLPLVE